LRASSLRGKTDLMKPAASESAGWASSKPPLLRFLDRCYQDFSHETGGTVADYIPELGKADPDHFGIGLATLDGHVYEVGDTKIPFTIQSMSKPFVFALALDTLGAGRVESAIGVEPSGDPFNSIRLNAENHPFNPMVNAGAITCSGLIHEAKGNAAFEYIRQALGRFAGRELDVDEAVYASESATGDRNRAIGYLLRTNAVIKDNVAAVLDVYFRQCAILVTARDTAIMAATLANRGVNPVTGEQVMTPYAISRTLSVMTSSGMYDYAGEWIYRVGIPAKSGVGGGILAALPARLGLGSYSPRLDTHGNSVRGIKVCEALSSHYDLHMLNRSDDARNSIIADYTIGKSPSRRVRRPHEQKILAAHHQDVRVIELVGTLSFSNVDYVSRKLAAKPRPQFVIFDLRRVASVTRAGARLLAEEFRELANFHVTVILSGIKRSSAGWKIVREWTDGISNLRDFYLLDTAIEWAEDQVVYRHGGAIDFHDTTELSEQPLLAGLSGEELAALASLGSIRNCRPGEKIVTAGDPATSLFFLRSGVVHVTLPDGVRLATLTAGMAFGEMALLEPHRSADVLADAAASAIEISISDFERFRDQRPKAGERIMRNLAQLLADRLIVANTKVDLLTAT
jgi:glutaminase